MGESSLKGRCSFFSGGNVLKAEIIRLVTGLRKFKQHPGGIECLVCDNGNAVIAVHGKYFFILRGCVFHCDTALTGDNLHAPLVITGLHHMSNAIDMQLIADFGGTMLWPMIALSNIAQGSAVLGMIYLQRKNAAAQEVNVPACISCYLGVTEPAMFGVNLKYNFPFICGMIGSATAAVVCVATSTTANAIGVGGIPGILSIQPTYMLSFALCMLIAIVVPFMLTVAIGKKKGVA